MNPALDIATSTERVIPTEKLRCGAPRYDPGGGGINVARAVHRLGGDSVAVFPAGGGSGEQLCRLLDAEDVAYAAIPIAGMTRESLAVVERTTGRQYRFLLPGAALEENDQRRCLTALTERLPGASYLVASGSLPPGVPDDFYARVCELARRHRVRFVLDTSGPALAAAGSGAFLLKASLGELQELAGRPLPTAGDWEQAAHQIVKAGRAEKLVLSLGAQGALLATGDEVIRVPPVAVEAIGSVGAGDSMVAGTVLALTWGWPIGKAVRYGSAAGAAALLRPGTELCDRQETDRLFRMIDDT
jgi:6-phosphofructokinase 2